MAPSETEWKLKIQKQVVQV